MLAFGQLTLVAKILNNGDFNQKECLFGAGVGKHFPRRPDNKYFWIHRPYTVSVATTQLCWGRQSGHRQYVNRRGLAPIQLLLQTRLEGRLWPMGCSLQIPDLDPTEAVQHILLIIYMTTIPCFLLVWPSPGFIGCLPLST